MELKMENPADETFYLLTEYYHHNPQPLLSVLSDDCCWISPMDQIFLGAETIRAQFADGILSPIFHLIDPKFHQMNSSSPDMITVYGEYYAKSDLESKMLLSERQRITFCYRKENNTWLLYHMHVSNPWSQVSGDEVFPDQISRQTYDYLQECIEEQKKQIETQTAILKRLSFEDNLTKLFNRNKFIQASEYYKKTGMQQLGIVYFDLDGLKTINDQLGHSAGDRLISRVAHLIRQEFDGKAYRIGGDEFLVMDTESDETTFLSAIASIRKNFSDEQIQISIGYSWRNSQCDIDNQFDEADHLMYVEKKQHNI